MAQGVRFNPPASFSQPVDVSGLDRLVQSFGNVVQQDQQKRQLEGLIGIIETGSPEESRAALVELATINPQAASVVIGQQQRLRQEGQTRQAVEDVGTAINQAFPGGQAAGGGGGTLGERITNSIRTPGFVPPGRGGAPNLAPSQQPQLGAGGNEFGGGTAGQLAGLPPEQQDEAARQIVRREAAQARGLPTDQFPVDEFSRPDQLIQAEGQSVVTTPGGDTVVQSDTFQEDAPGTGIGTSQTEVIPPATKQQVNSLGLNKKGTSALSRLLVKNKATGEAVLKILQTENAAQIKRRVRQVDSQAKMAKRIDDADTDAEKQLIIRLGAQDALAQNPNADISGFVRLSEADPETLKILTGQMQDRATDFKTIAASAEKVQAAKTKAEREIEKERRTFETDLGKAISDQDKIVEEFGEDSPQAQAIGEVVQSEREGEGPDLTKIAGLRKEFTKQSGDFIKLRDAFKKVQNASANAAGDLALIFNFMKILDPTSVVREGEQATASNARGVAEGIRNTWNRILAGEKLAPEQRARFKAEAKKQFDPQLESQLSLEREFGRIAEESEFPRSQVIVDFVTEFRPQLPGETQIGEFTVEEVQ